jgi:DNA-binding MarR family transcriptional regulator
LTRQVLRSQVFQQRPSLEAFAGLLRSHSALTRVMNAQLVTEHGLTINDYEVLLLLARAPERQLRRVDLAESVLLTASGITRLLDGLERAGYVTKAQCETDGRVTYAVLTDDGLDKLREAGETHVAGIREVFEGRFSEDELQTLASLLSRLPADGEPGSCSID